jgi:hypothetical protein
LRIAGFSEDDAENHSPSNASAKAAAWSDGYEPPDMICEILSSDVEFAQGMLKSSHSDAEILAYLTSRGIEPAKAAELLDDLRHGRKPNAQPAFVPGAGGSLTTNQPRPARAAALPAAEAPRRHSHRGSLKRSGFPWWFILLIVIFIMALGYAFFEMGGDASSDSLGKAKHELPSPPGK